MDIEILMPKYTKNLITNPSFENGISGWVCDGSESLNESRWTQIASFEDGLLTPNPTGADAIVDVDGKLSANVAAALSGNYGLEINNDISNTVAYVQLTDPNNEKNIVIEFLFNPNDNSFAVGQDLVLFNITNVTVTYLRNNGGVYQFYSSYIDDVGGIIDYSIVDVPIGQTSKVRIEWGAATAVGENDGFIRFYLNGTLQDGVSGIDNDTRSINTINFGAVASMPAAISGSFYMDNLQWGPYVELGSSYEKARFGRKSFRDRTFGDNNNEGIYTRVDTTNINGPVVGSAYVRGEGRVRLRLYDGLTGAQYYSQTMQLHDRYWQRLSVNGVTVGSDDYRLYVETDGTAPQEVTFYMDGAQLEEGGVLTTYCDGDQPGCRWNGVIHASTSEREDTSTEGGEYVPFKDDECDPDSYYTELSGFGMPPVTINRQQMALSPGSFLDSSRVDERVLMINSFFKDRYAQKRKGNEKRHIYELRQRIEDLVKPDISPDSPEFWLRVGQDGKWLYIKAVYEAGMEFEFDVRNKWTSASSIRFLCMQPYWVEDSQETALLDYGYELADDVFYAMRVDGEWKELLNGVNDDVLGMAFDENDVLYVAGAFTQDDDGLNVRRIGRANNDYTLITQCGPGLVNNGVVKARPHQNGKVYLGGTFTQDGNGVAQNRIVEYDPVTNTFAAMGVGLNAQVYDVQISPTGRVYCCGEFTTAGGAAADRIAYWDGAWHPVGSISADVAALARLWSLIVINNDLIYAFGEDVAGVNAAWKWDGASWVSIYSSAEAPGAYTSTLGKDGSVYFVSQENDGSKLFRWNGSSAEQLGSDLLDAAGGGPQVYTISTDDEGFIYLLTNQIYSVGDIIVDSPILIWNGSSFVQADIEAQVNLDIGEVVVRKSGDIYVGFGGELDNVNVSSITYVNNVGTAQVFPIISIDGPGKVIWIENQTSKQRAYMNYTTQENELLEIDFRTGKKTVVSNYRGNVPDAILPNSEDILLAAGRHDEAKANKFAVLIVDAVNPTVQIRYTPTHWSIDALDML